ncbi:hypothetical protein [Rhodopseudomonas pseudopalustris]|uniref:Uncharacterized protein n=1 Tax=Rhodopseudomonas pseudopalustris TaxID=1513892 RepID=A0A1H8UE96_9BRAD|nr:hypothetical protein [Rhodopseudomonas pseudopalustris]SEP01582.1 hypothetical protein SAMN05444123_1071 [Rhodopseudomonas pseudopalustris]
MRSSGEIMWQGQRIFVSEALIGELIGIAELQTGDQIVRFCHYDIGLIDRLHQFHRCAAPTGTALRAGAGGLKTVDNHPGLNWGESCRLKSRLMNSNGP